jgi:hypothetical protein
LPAVPELDPHSLLDVVRFHGFLLPRWGVPFDYAI